MLIYFAAPLFCKAEQAFNMKLTEKLEELGFTVFLPQRDGIGVEISKPPYSEMAIEELRQAIFTIDRDKVLEADIFLFVLDGRVPDDGACVELGIAYAQKYLLKQDKLIIGLHTDMRGAYAFLDTKLNPLILGSFDDIAEDENALIAVLEKYEPTKQK
jgi:nucleoside 2-deoxyribosyltransferase